MQEKKIIEEFVEKNFLKGRSIENQDNASLLEEQVVDSVGVLELVAFLEETFKIRVEDEEIIPDNLDSINKIASYVRSKV